MSVTSSTTVSLDEVIVSSNGVVPNDSDTLTDTVWPGDVRGVTVIGAMSGISAIARAGKIECKPASST